MPSAEQDKKTQELHDLQAKYEPTLRGQLYADNKLRVLFNAKQTYLDGLRNEYSKLPAYPDKDSLDKKMAKVEADFDKQAIEAGIKGVENKGSPAQYEPDDSDQLTSRVTGFLKGKAGGLLGAIPIVGPFIEMIMQVIPDALDSVSEFVKVNILHQPPRFSDDKKILAGIADRFGANSPIVIEGKRFALTPAQQAELYAQMTEDFASPSPSPASQPLTADQVRRLAEARKAIVASGTSKPIDHPGDAPAPTTGASGVPLPPPPVRPTKSPPR